MMAKNKKSMSCLECRKWKTEEDLIISPKGSYCEDCYYENHE